MKLELCNLTKKYGESQGVIDISASFTEGIYGILGPNGAGKSTLMNLIVGNCRPDSGKILLDGTETISLGKKYLNYLGYMPQVQIYYPEFSGIQFLDYMASLKDVDKETSSRQIEEMMTELGLWQDRYKKLKHYSGGMLQRLLLIQALLGDPKILILDEPTAGMDPWQRIAVRNLIGRVGLNKIVIISTHVVQDLEQIASDVLFMNKARILEMNTPEQLMKNVQKKTWTFSVPKEEVGELEKYGIITGIVRKENTAIVRMIVNQDDIPLAGIKVPASLEDVYLDYFGMDCL